MRKYRHLFKDLLRINIPKTLYFNFKCFTFKVAIKCPVFLYGKVKIHSLNGNISIKGKVFRGMIKIGYRWLDLFPTSYLPTQLLITGQLTFEGGCIISGGAAIFVQSKQASLCIGDSVTIGGGTMIKSLDILRIGNKTRIAGNCTIMNSNMHFIKNIETGIVNKPWGPILIGKNCWINSGTIVTKGSVIPDYTITSRNAFISKDFSEYGPHLFIVGSPGRVASAKVQRIFSKSLEQKLKNYFRVENPLEDVIMLEPGEEIDNLPVF